MVQCCVLGCQNRTEQGICDVTFHRFPSDETKSKIWTLACGRCDWKPTKNSRLCSNHFEPDCFTTRGNKRFLKPTALPTKNIHASTPPDEPEILKSSLEINHPFKPNAEVSQIASSSNSGIVQKSSKRPCENSEEETPRKKRLRNLAANRLRKLRSAQQAKRRLIKRNEKLTDIITELRTKSLLSFEEAEFLSSIDTTNRDFLKRLTGVEAKNAKYSPSLRKFALSLHFINPSAYSYVRQTFNTCLPHPQTLTNWYRSVDGKPGFTKESLEAIKLKTQNTDKKIYVALSFDEMSIRKGVSLCDGEFFGTVDIGTGICSDEARLARQALVFMATAINDSWKIPIGYFLIDSLSGEQKAELTKRSIELLTQSNVDVVSVTCDGCPSNFAMARTLGCKIDCSDPRDINTEFKVNVDGVDKSVFFYPDPPHMLKLLRNCLGDKGVIFGAEGEINWKFINLLHQLQENEGLHLKNKLRKSHIQYAKQIMKVKLAAQTFSLSVADAIDFCRYELELPEFQNSECTAEFIRKINNLFDILNSRNLNAYNFKKPINENNYEQISSFLNDILIYLWSLKLQDGQQILQTNRKVPILGFCCAIRSLLLIYEHLVASGDLIFLPSYKMCQDHLECFFSAIRAKGGFNNNPSPVQFRAAYKRLVVHGELKHIATGNCTILENIEILTYTQSQHDKKINSTSYMLQNSIQVEESKTDEDLDQILHDHDYLYNPNSISEYANEVIIYIAGYVVRKLLKLIKCDNCLQSIVDATKSIGRFIYQIDKGGLSYPNADVVEICKLTEQVLKRNLKSDLIKRKKVQEYLLHETFKLCTKRHYFENHGGMFDHSPLDSHELLLIKIIIFEYLKLRLYYIAKSISEPDVKIRNVYNKLILFRNQ